jgi:elongation factor G
VHALRSFPPSKIRNVALVGHGGAGKTTLVEALLAAAGAISRLGRVEDGTTVSDYEPEAVKRGISVSLSVAPMEWSGHKINLIDTPGYADFSGEVCAALSVADLAVFVVSAVDGVEAQTRDAWRLATAAGLPRMFFVNKLDRERASFDRTLDELRATFGSGVAPLEWPIGVEADFTGVVDLLTDTAITYRDGRATSGPLTDDVATVGQAQRDALVEGIVVADDALVERYLDGDVPSAAELEHTMALGVAAGTVFPVVCGSALRTVGVDRLADFLCEIGPGPADREPVRVHAGGAAHPVVCDAAGPPLAFVFKTVADPYVGKVTLFKVLSGTIRPDDVLTNPRTHADERVHGPFALRGRDRIEIPEVGAGDIAAVAKLTGTRTGDTLAPRGTPVTVPPFEVPAAVLATAIRPRSNGDDEKLMTALHRLQDEDVALTVHRDDTTHQTIVSGLGETHLTITLERLARKFGVAVEREPVRVAYRETITVAAEAEGRYKKQTGGHGQFGVVSIRVEPAGRGAGFSFIDRIVGGAIPRQYIPAVEKGIVEAMGRGGHFGFPVVDLTVTCLDGRYHPVDSSEMSFKMAGALALRQAVARATPVILEPISSLEVVVAPGYQGDVMADVVTRRGRIEGTDTLDGGEQAVRALVPTAELARYAVDLRGMTAGTGRFSFHHAYYDVLPSHLFDRVAAASPHPPVGASS